MSFEIESLQKAKCTEVLVLSQKNRDPGDNPGVALSFNMMLGNDALSYFDGSLKSFLYTKAGGSAKQGDLAGVDPVSDMPNLTAAGMKLGKLSWDQELTGYSLTIDQGIGGQSNVELEDCKLSGFVIDAKEGGSFMLTFKAEAPDASEKTFGKLAHMKNTEVSILLTAPVVESDLVS